MEKNADYVIRQSILFENRRGFVLGECPMAPAPFVTWQFTEENGKRDYYWGHYYTEAATAVRDFTARGEDYVRRYHVREVEQPEPERYKYYSTQRPVDIGTFPKIFYDEPRHFQNYDERRPVEGGAYRAWGELVYTRPLTEVELRSYELKPSRNNLDVRRTMDAQAQTVGKWEDANHVPDTKRLTFFYSDFGSYVAKDFVTPERLAEAARGVEAQRDAQEHRAAKRPIAEQLKDAARLAGENRGQPAPKKDAPDKGDR